MEKEKRTLLERTAEMFRPLGELAPGQPRVEVLGSSRVLVENHRGVVEYGSRRIDINGGRTLVSVAGEELEIRAMNRHELLIVGRIEAVRFLR